CASEPEMPATFCRCRASPLPFIAPPPGSRLPTCPPSDAPRHARAACRRSSRPPARRAPHLRALALVDPCKPAQPRRKALRRLTVERQRQAVEELVEDGV